MSTQEATFPGLDQLSHPFMNFLNTLWAAQPQRLITILALPALLSLAFLLFLRPNDSIPGPFLYSLTKWRLAYDDWRGIRTRTIYQLHQKYGPVVRIGPNEISFNSLGALKTIYGAGSGFARTPFYRMFDVYGHQNLFTFGPVAQHSERKKLVAHAYSRSSILKTTVKGVEDLVGEFMDLVKRDPEVASETFSSLHYFALDNITHFLYGDDFGGTAALKGEIKDRKMLRDVLDPARRKLAWFAAHLPKYTKWLMTRTGIQEKLVSSLGLLPMKKPTVYTGIRNHALKSWYAFLHSTDAAKEAAKTTTIIGRLWDQHISQKENGLQDLEIASEVADHLLAGVDTTSDTLMFLFWALSLPENSQYQEKLIQEITSLPASSLDPATGLPKAEISLQLPYLDAVLKETLRLYSPLPASEPRTLSTPCTIDGYLIQPETVVGIAPYTLHRNAAVFPEPLVFNPERWLSSDAAQLAEMKKWFWAFSSGGRMCIGIHLAMVEMTALTAAVYKRYRTRVRAGLEDTTPGITSRFEVFYDEVKGRMKEHECFIDFIPQ